SWYFNADEIFVGSARVYIEKARTPEEQTRGLMGRKSLAEDHGMLFLFSEAAPRVFWNRNTYIPLDVIWIRDGKVIGASSLPMQGEEIVQVFSPEAADAVLEVNQGWAARHSVKLGDKVLY
ncbi:MAG: DUF192 domain-containing protein, partial [Candidatus Ryanbacteria bacterium]|nr:DUF192 domain-containing protein [Candidatus Ryanbacteria bacterium]